LIQPVRLFYQYSGALAAAAGQDQAAHAQEERARRLGHGLKGNLIDYDHAIAERSGAEGLDGINEVWSIGRFAASKKEYGTPPISFCHYCRLHRSGHWPRAGPSSRTCHPGAGSASSQPLS
jgi:hypothetical protein